MTLGRPKEPDNRGPVVLRPFSALVEFHVREGTHVDGPRCPMFPSCAAFADRGVKQYGILGFLLFVDRLFFREWGRLDERYRITPRNVSHETRYLDVLEDSLPYWDVPRASLLQDPFSGDD